MPGPPPRAGCPTCDTGYRRCTVALTAGSAELPNARAGFGLLVLDGLLARHVDVGLAASNEFLGPGDLLCPRATADFMHVRWEVLAPARLALLDEDFAQRIRSWPELTAALLDRAARRADAQALQAALHGLRRIEDRVLLALWHFAGRWGHVGAEGRIVALPNITGEVLARYVGARRQSVSTAVARLTRAGAIERRPDGSLVVRREPVAASLDPALAPRVGESRITC